MPPLITRQDIANGAVSAQPRQFSKIAAKQRAARVFFYWPENTLVPGTCYKVAMPHALGRVPQSFRIVMLNTALSTTAPVITASTPPEFSINYIALQCTTPNTWAEIEVT